MRPPIGGVPGVVVPRADGDRGASFSVLGKPTRGKLQKAKLLEITETFTKLSTLRSRHILRYQLQCRRCDYIEEECIASQTKPTRLRTMTARQTQVKARKPESLLRRWFQGTRTPDGRGHRDVWHHPRRGRCPRRCPRGSAGSAHRRQRKQPQKLKQFEMRGLAAAFNLRHGQSFRCAGRMSLDKKDQCRSTFTSRRKAKARDFSVSLRACPPTPAAFEFEVSGVKGTAFLVITRRF